MKRDVVLGLVIFWLLKYFPLFYDSYCKNDDIIYSVSRTLSNNIQKKKKVNWMLTMINWSFKNLGSMIYDGLRSSSFLKCLME